MKIFMTLGVHRIPRLGSFAALNARWPQQVGMKGAPLPAGGCRSAAAIAGYHTRFRAFAHPLVTSLPVTDRLRTSASEP